MNEKIYFIIDTPIVKSYISYYALDAFSEHNIEYVLIDVSPLINKRAYKSVKSDLIDYSEPNIYLCKSFDMLEKMVNDMPEEAMVIDSGGYNLDRSAASFPVAPKYITALFILKSPFLFLF